MAGRGEIPRRIKKKGTGFKGLSMRELLIVCLGLPLALLAGIGLAGLPIWLRAGLAVLIAGVTLALAFGTHQGQTFEQWVAHRLRRRWRRMARRWLLSASCSILAKSTNGLDNSRPFLFYGSKPCQSRALGSSTKKNPNSAHRINTTA
ncbi:MAG: PrgI family protein [Chloroflexota bacterium]|nr:PrgI family protein [Chloroflexota bacterium]